MSSADLFEDGFPHGTKEGYDRGCRGHGSCPGVLDFGRSCNQASMSYAGDYTYKQRVDAGMGPAEIAELERAAGVKPAKAPMATTSVTPATVTVADSETPLGDLAEPVAVEKPKPAARVSGLTPEKHGTMAGYSAGCRLKDQCPGIERTGVSCTQAVSAYQRELKLKKAAEKAAVRPQVAAEVPAEAEPVVPEIASEAVAEPAVEAVPVDSGTRVRAEGLLTELADAKDEIARLTVYLDEARQWGRGLESHSQMVNGLLQETRAELAQVTEQRDGLEAKLAEMQLHFDIQEGRLRAIAALDTSAVVPAMSGGPADKSHGASLQVRQMGDAFAFDISGGGEAVRLELAFESGQLQRAAVTTGN